MLALGRTVGMALCQKFLYDGRLGLYHPTIACKNPGRLPKADPQTVFPKVGVVPPTVFVQVHRLRPDIGLTEHIRSRCCSRGRMQTKNRHLHNPQYKRFYRNRDENKQRGRQRASIHLQLQTQLPICPQNKPPFLKRQAFACQKRTNLFNELCCLELVHGWFF